MIYAIRLKGLNFGHPNPSSPLSTNFAQTIQFRSKHTQLVDVLNCHSTPSSPPNLINFGIFLENFNNEINIVTYSFFFAKAQRKANRFSPSQLLWKASVPSVFPLESYKSSTKDVSGWKQYNREIERLREHGKRWKKEICCS